MFAKINNKRFFFDIDGAGLRPAGDSWNEPTPLVCIHGSFFEHSYLKSALTPLSEHTQIIYLDLPGFGRSEPVTPDDWNAMSLADDILALLDYLGIESANLLSHSYGCLISSYIAQTAPERIANQLLLNPVAIDKPYFYHKVKTLGGDDALDAAIALYDHGNDELLETFLDQVTPLFFQQPLDVNLMARGQMSIHLTLASIKELANFCWHECLDRTQVNSFLFTGKKDLYCADTYFKQLLKGINSTYLHLEEFESSGHFVMLDDSERLLSHIRQHL